MSRDLLIGAGMCLVVLGIVLRTVARTQRREIALRKQREIADRAAPETSTPLAFWEKHLGHLANALLFAGVIAVIAAFFG